MAQRVKTSGTKSENEWCKEWKQVTTNENEWQRMTMCGNLPVHREQWKH